MELSIMSPAKAGSGAEKTWLLLLLPQESKSLVDCLFLPQNVLFQPMVPLTIRASLLDLSIFALWETGKSSLVLSHPHTSLVLFIYSCSCNCH